MLSSKKGRPCTVYRTRRQFTKDNIEYNSVTCFGFMNDADGDCRALIENPNGFVEDVDHMCIRFINE